MERRSFVGALAAAVAGLLVPRPPAAAPEVVLRSEIVSAGELTDDFVGWDNAGVWCSAHVRLAPDSAWHHAEAAMTSGRPTDYWLDGAPSDRTVYHDVLFGEERADGRRSGEPREQRRAPPGRLLHARVERAAGSPQDARRELSVSARFAAVRSLIEARR